MKEPEFHTHEITLTSTSHNLILELCKKTKTPFEEGMNEVFEIGMQELRKQEGWVEYDPKLDKKTQDIVVKYSKEFKVPEIVMTDFIIQCWIKEKKDDLKKKRGKKK